MKKLYVLFTIGLTLSMAGAADARNVYPTLGVAYVFSENSCFYEDTNFVYHTCTPGNYWETSLPLDNTSGTKTIKVSAYAPGNLSLMYVRCTAATDNADGTAFLLGSTDTVTGNSGSGVRKTLTVSVASHGYVYVSCYMFGPGTEIGGINYNQ